MYEKQETSSECVGPVDHNKALKKRLSASMGFEKTATEDTYNCLHNQFYSE